MGKRKHGEGLRKNPSRTWLRWMSMRRRCNNPAQPSYKYYGAKGIRVCKDWNDSYATFLMDMGECPPGMTLDRINSGGDYGPHNCRWATMKVQQRNRSNNCLLTFNGASKPIATWAEEIGMKQKTLRARIFDYGWTVERALSVGIIGKSVQNPAHASYEKHE